MTLLIVGLGNPGKEYQRTRHNIGFTTLNAFAQAWECGDWRLDKKSNSLIAECVMPNLTQPILLAKPQTFMNNSGKSVKSLLPKSRLGMPKRDLVVVHDDIDIPLGKVKVSRGSGSAGHKGIDSIIQALGTKDFTRIRIGILPTEGKPNDVENFVLQKFSPNELPILNSAIKEAEQIILNLIKT